MKQHRILLIGSLIAVVLSLVIMFRSVSAKNHFDRAVIESLKTTEGYDQRFIDMVNRLEELLATRARFGYQGRKDPMTGSIREVVQPKPVAAPAPRPRVHKAVPSEPETPVAPTDPVRLTAVIADAAGKKITAVVMDGERSLSVDPGDLVAGRKITKITNDGIYMESDSCYFFYDIYGNVVKKSKETGEISSFLKEEQEAKRKETPKAVKKQDAPRKKRSR